MAEREIYNPLTGEYELAYDDGIYEGGMPQGSTPPPTTTQPTTTAPPATTTTPPPPPPKTGGGGKTREQIEAEGRAYDQANGLIGGYFDGTRWVNGSPRGGGSGGIDGGGGGEGFGGEFSGGIDPNAGFEWPKYNPRKFSFGDFGGFKPFTAPTMDEILGDPVLQAQLTEGQKRIKQDRAFQGVLNTGGTLKDLFDWQGDRIKLGANDAFDRKFKTYDINERQNPFNTWNANKGLALDSFDRNAGQEKDAFMFNQYEPAKARWKQNFDKWSKTGDWLTTTATAFPD